MREKIGFSLGDGAANFIFQTIMLLQLSFYTDSFGISAAAAGWLFLVARLFGAVADPVFGALADRTNTRWGKFRPWILFTAVPFGIIGFLAFTTPDFGPSGKLIYAYITYILLMLVYSANNVPYAALSGVITGNMAERNSLSSVRFIVVTLATLAIQGFALPMVNHFGQGNSAKGYQITMGIFSVLAVIFFLITFFTTKERIVPAPEQKTPLKQDIADLLKNRPWLIMFLVFIVMFIFLGIRNSILLYYFKYYLDKDSMVSLLETVNKGLFGLIGKLGLLGASADIAGNTFSIINIFSQLITIVGLAFSRPLANRFGKRDVFRYGLIMCVVLSASFIFIPPQGVALTLILQLLFQFTWGVAAMSLPWAMMADVADFSEWKNNRRATAITFAGIIIGLKVGLAIGGAMAGSLLNMYGYVANVEQTPHARLGIRMITSVWPAAFLAIGIVLLFFYQINKSAEIQMQNELAERRKAMA
ncbi:MAG TPA: MFS transporter [Bacteroidales bacterium]|nr:MFS transporter [Bacteroidales bacterium]HRR92958.1 MFS transporter [Bacteroidales bacterium]HRT88915.1 MFS transporter [Bacteroidales bacterium]